jgi:uncharacterized membrane protein YidH (DUF202 family)
MNSQEPFNLIAFTETTQKACLCSSISIFIVILFIISPLSHLFKTSLFMKIVALCLLIYTLKLNNYQTNLLKTSRENVNNQNIYSQLSMNVICSYVFSLFIVLLVLFVIKSFF